MTKSDREPSRDAGTGSKPTARRIRGRAADRNGPAVHELAASAAREAVDRRGQDVLLLDLRDLTPATDYFVIASGDSDVQVKAIAERIEDRLRLERGIRPWHVEGLRHARWVLLDYVDFVVHVFHREAREYYDLERLWADAPAESFSAEHPDGMSVTGD
ncbi:MAG TPA: ribosome silencing factor [Gemmatimonadota bacterium]|nr:ribosome silencing factor [Gemmatimonadota bacterium]